MAVDMCIGFFLSAWHEGAIKWPEHAKILEIGCAEADWCETAKSLRPDVHLTAIDYRNPERPKADVLLSADILEQDFPENSFDAIVAVSTLEHIGLGAYGDPLDEDGDIKTLANCARWLKPGGELYFDVPWRGKGESQFLRKYRAYNNETWEKRLRHPLFVEVWSHIAVTDHPDGPYRAVVYRKIV